MIDIESPRYGPKFLTESGWIAELGQGPYCHRFGGDSWRLSDLQQATEFPALLLILDLADPKLSTINVTGIDELPLFSHINSDAWLHPQIFQLEPESRLVKVVDLQAAPSNHLEEEDQFPSPIPEKLVTLRPMVSSEVPSDEESYWSACDSFIGGASFIRILGPPLWLQYVEHHNCRCGQPMEYICSIGYENYDNPSGIVQTQPFFIGEAALYFFLCKSCLCIKVTSQPS